MLPPSSVAMSMKSTKSTTKAKTLNPSNQTGLIPFKQGLQISSSYKVDDVSFSPSLLPFLVAFFRETSYFIIINEEMIAENRTKMAQTKTKMALKTLKFCPTND